MKLLIRSFHKNDPFYLIDGSKNQTYFNSLKKRMVLFEFEALRDLQPIMCFNIITWSKRYSLFPILSSLIGPSLRNFRITL